MSEIRCPKCQKSFEIDENSYASIVQQVRTEEFNKELNSRLKIEKEKFDKDLEIIKREQIEEKDKAINLLKHEYHTKLSNKDDTIRIRDEEIIRIIVNKFFILNFSANIKVIKQRNINTKNL